MDPRNWKILTIVISILFILFTVLTFANVLCSPLDLCYKSELGDTCYQAKRRTGQIVSELK